MSRIGEHLKWHGCLSVTFWKPRLESDTRPRVMRIDMGIREPMNAYYSGVDLIGALLDLSLPRDSGTRWEDGPLWQDPDRAFDMPEPPVEEDLTPPRSEVNSEQGDAEARQEDDAFNAFPLQVMHAPNVDRTERGPGLHARTTIEFNSRSASLSRESTAVASSGDEFDLQGRGIWRNFRTLRPSMGVEGYDGDGGRGANLGDPATALPNYGRCLWKQGVTTRQFALEAERRIMESGETSLLKKLTTILGNKTLPKSKEEHTPYFLNLWTTSRPNVHNMIEQIINLIVRGTSEPTLLSKLLHDDWPRPSPRGLRRDQYAGIFRTHLWDGPPMPDGPWGLVLPMESDSNAKRFRVYCQKGVLWKNVAYQFYVRHGQDDGTGTLLPKGCVDPRKRGHKIFRPPIFTIEHFNLICVNEKPETWNSYTFAPDPQRPREGVLIPSRELPKEKYLAVSPDPQMAEVTPGRCFLFRGESNHYPRWNRAYRYRMGDHMRYVVHDRTKKLPNPPCEFFFVDDRIIPPVPQQDCFQPILAVCGGIPRTDTVYYYHAHDTAQPYMGYFVPEDHYQLVQRQSYHFGYPALRPPGHVSALDDQNLPQDPWRDVKERDKAAILDRAIRSAVPAEIAERLTVSGAMGSAGPPAKAGDFTMSGATSAAVPLEVEAIEPAEEQDPKQDAWVTADEILGLQGYQTDEVGESSRAGDETGE